MRQLHLPGLVLALLVNPIDYAARIEGQLGLLAGEYGGHPLLPHEVLPLPLLPRLLEGVPLLPLHEELRAIESPLEHPAVDEAQEGYAGGGEEPVVEGVGYGAAVPL